MDRVYRMFTDGWYMDLAATAALVVGIFLVVTGDNPVPYAEAMQALGGLLVAGSSAYTQLLARGQWEEDDDG